MRQPVFRRRGRQRHQRGQTATLALIEQGLIRHRAGRDNPHHRALHRTFGRCLADLLANRHRFARTNQPRQIILVRMRRNARHRDRLARRLPARRQRQIKNARRPLGIRIKQLVKIPHAIKQQHIRVREFHRPELLHHRGMLA